MAKRVRLSDDDGANWHTLPGNSAELSNEAGAIDDTIFGQIFQSSQTGLIGWSVSANGLYKGFAGYVAKILKSGTTTAFTGEAMEQVSGLNYKITDATKNVWDRSVAPTIYDNAVEVDAADIESIDYLFGRVTFDAAYTVTGPVTADGSYFPMSQVARANGFTLTQTANPIDDTDFETAQGNDGHRTFLYGLKTVSMDLTGIYASANGYKALLTGREELVLEINPDGNQKSVARGFFKPMSQGQSGNVGDLEAETVTFELSVPDDDDVETPFKWIHEADTTLNTAVQKALTAWLASDEINVQYLPDGTTGITGACIVTDLTLAGGLEVMNEFTVNVQGVDEPSAVA